MQLTEQRKKSISKKEKYVRKLIHFLQLLKSMQLAPSEIHFIRDYSIHKPDEHLLNYFRNSLLSLKDLPKIQVVERNGAWFALNNSYLHVFLELEKQGKCTRIPVDVVPLSRVPKTVQETMVINVTNCQDWDVGDAKNVKNGGVALDLNDKNGQPETSNNYTAVQHTILEMCSETVPFKTNVDNEDIAINMTADSTSQDVMDSSDGKFMYFLDCFTTVVHYFILIVEMFKINHQRHSWS